MRAQLQWLAMNCRHLLPISGKSGFNERDNVEKWYCVQIFRSFVWGQDSRKSLSYANVFIACASRLMFSVTVSSIPFSSSHKSSHLIMFLCNRCHHSADHFCLSHPNRELCALTSSSLPSEVGIVDRWAPVGESLSH